MTPTLAAIALLTTVNVAISFSPRPNLIWVVPSTMHRRGNLARSSGGQPSVGDRVVVTVVATGPASRSRRYYSAIDEGGMSTMESSSSSSSSSSEEEGSGGGA